MPEPVDWVARRSGCSLKILFESLYGQVKLDVDRINALEASVRRHSSLSVGPLNERPVFFVVEKAGHLGPSFVQFEDRSGTIEVAGSGVALRSFSVSIEWYELETRCRVLMDDEEAELWRVSKRALEPLVGWRSD